MIWNFRRKSTRGWSICNILLDFTGGLFSFLQMWMEHHNGKNLNINPVKLILSIMCMVYDLVFIVQHYWLYPEGKEGNLIQDDHDEKGTERAFDNVETPAINVNGPTEPVK